MILNFHIQYPHMTVSKVQDILQRLKETWFDLVVVLIYTIENKPLMFQYKNIKMIGRGTFGVVVQIRDMKTNKNYALKKVFQDARFHNRELEIFKSLKHDNIVKLHFYNYDGEDAKGKLLNLYMDYYPNNLESLISDKKVNVKPFIRDWLLQLVQALNYLHSKGICHRDIKPANILIDESLNKLVICDMGSAKFLSDGKNNITYVCSRYYRSPENILGIESYDFKIDIWSAGCVFVECHTGQTLFKGGSNSEMISKILNIIKCSTADLYEMGVPEKEYKGRGIKYFLWEQIDDKTLIEMYEKMLVFNPSKRVDSNKLLDLLYNKKNKN